MTPNSRQTDITLLIPTKGRSEFLRRTLTYYKDLSFDGVISILDSSEGDALLANKRLIQEVTEKLNIEYHADSTMSELAATGYLVNKVTTTYVAELQDDNFVVPNGIKSCINFLEHHPDYSACRGIGISVKTVGSVPHGPIRRCAVNNQPTTESQTAASRYLDLVQNYSDIHFAIHRTNVYQTAFKHAHNEDSLFFKILAMTQVFLAGKVKFLKVMHLVRHIQDKPYATNESSDLYFWLTRDSWPTFLKEHRLSVVQVLMEQDNLSETEAQNVFRKGMMTFLLWLLIERLPHQININFDDLTHPNSTWAYFSQNSVYNNLPVKLVSFAVRRCQLYYELLACRILNREVVDNLVLQKRTESMLSALTNMRSSYSLDFMPIFNLITKPPS